jgi:hypothetical protein
VIFVPAAISLIFIRRVNFSYENRQENYDPSKAPMITAVMPRLSHRLRLFVGARGAGNHEIGQKNNLERHLPSLATVLQASNYSGV